MCILDYNADGTFTGRIADADTRTEGYNLLLATWRARGVGTQLPESQAIGL